jgi:hypothetical protein
LTVGDLIDTSAFPTGDDIDYESEERLNSSRNWPSFLAADDRTLLSQKSKSHNSRWAGRFRPQRPCKDRGQAQ